MRGILELLPGIKLTCETGMLVELESSIARFYCRNLTDKKTSVEKTGI